MKFKWQPTSYDAAVRALNGPPALLNAILGAIRTEGELPCPAPDSDPSGEYRVALSGRAVEIQRRDSQTGRWAAAQGAPNVLPVGGTYTFPPRDEGGGASEGEEAETSSLVLRFHGEDIGEVTAGPVVSPDKKTVTVRVEDFQHSPLLAVQTFDLVRLRDGAEPEVLFHLLNPTVGRAGRLGGQEITASVVPEPPASDPWTIRVSDVPTWTTVPVGPSKRQRRR